VPDVAMVADNILSIATDTSTTPPTTGVHYYTWGTSAASPLWAGYLALVNQQVVAAGKPLIGFINPAFYNIGQSSLYNSCFNDITSGSNTWSGSPNKYYAEPGYDLCTGWGSPGANLIDELERFVGPVFVNFNYTGSVQNGSYTQPYKTLAGGVGAVGSGGTIIIETAGSSSETMTITKPMTINASDGAATIGN
jgi:subtilase family serine protease